MSKQNFDHRDSSEFAIATKSFLQTCLKSKLVAEIIRLQIALAKVNKLAELPQPSEQGLAIALHPLVKVRQYLRSIAYDNLKGE